MDSNVNPQPTDAHIRINHEIHRELIRRKFTQRQRDIIDFILTLSWGCGKPSAIIPQLKHFELCGIRKNHIRAELITLCEKKVILWEQSLNVFQINKHYDQWSVDPIESFDLKKMKELINLNIENHSPNLTKMVPKKGTQFPNKEPKMGSQKGNSVTHSGTKFLKRELRGSQKGNFPVPNSGTVRRHYPSHIKAFSVSKESIKAIIKRSSSNKSILSEIDTEPKTINNSPNYSFGYLYQAYEKNFTEDGKVTPFETEEFGALFDDYGGEWMLKAMREASRHKVLTLAYVGGILKGYRKRGGPEAVNSGGRDSPTITTILENDPIMDRIRKADEQRLAQYGTA
ncbi:replication protein [Paenibacillus sp. FSL L8-0506]|uniref:replication protein n=1 Tax=Paenibacillus sp. FSL L8-0506 TaxID=2975335 RepID=UPI0030FC3392